jgi:hypothetical protein
MFYQLFLLLFLKKVNAEAVAFPLDDLTKATLCAIIADMPIQ